MISYMSLCRFISLIFSRLYVIPFPIMKEVMAPSSKLRLSHVYYTRSDDIEFKVNADTCGPFY